MTTKIRGSWERGPRQTLYVPPELHVLFSQIAERRGHQMSTLLACAFQAAVQRAARGEPGPPERLRRTGQGSMRTWAQHRWPQTRVEFTTWADLIRQCGYLADGQRSEYPTRTAAVSAVLLTWIEDYIAVDGDLTRLGRTSAVA